MRLLADVRSLGGHALTSHLRERGRSARSIGDAVRAGQLRRPRRGIVVTPTIDPELEFAARHGVLLTCVTQARRLGIWVSEDPRLPHVAARHRGYHVEAVARVHWSAAPALRPPDQLEDPLPNVLFHVAECLPFEHALATWESAINKGKTDVQQLAALKLPPEAARLLAECAPFSDSGLESLFRTRLRWLRLPIRTQSWLHGHRVDFLIADRLVVQIDGKQHAGQQKTADYKHDAELQARGFHVIRMGYTQVMFEWPSVQEQIMQAIAAGLHLPR